MYYVVIDSESLVDPLILNDFDFIKVIIEHEPKSESAQYHHVFFLSFPEAKAVTVIKKFSKSLKPGWYAFFWNKDILTIAFTKKRFNLKLPNPWNSAEYQKLKEHGRNLGIQEEFLDFQNYFERYKKILEKNL